MRKATWMVLIPVAVLAAACGKKSPAVDDALKNDLALASQAQATSPISPNEAGYAPQNAPQAQPARQATYSAPVRRTSTARRSSGVYRSSSSGSGGGNYPAPAPPVITETHTGRDAAIGAAAGAVLGATTSRNKVQGGIIGAAIGGVLGGVVGHNVDVTKRVGW